MCVNIILKKYFFGNILCQNKQNSEKIIKIHNYLFNHNISNKKVYIKKYIPINITCIKVMFLYGT